MTGPERSGKMRKRSRRSWHDVDKSDIRLEDVLRSFLMHQEDRNHSPKTVRWYSDMLGRFVEALGPEARLRDIDAAAVRRYLRGVRSNGLSKFTVNAYARTLKTFLRWLERERYLDGQVSHSVEMPKVPRYENVTIDVLSDEEIAHLLLLLEPSTDVGCRDRAIVCLMMESGLRLDEVASLQVDDVHLKDMYVKVRGKGDKEGYVPIGPTTLKALNRYMAHFRVPADPRTRRLFLNIFGEPLRYESIKSAFSRLAKKSGIKRLHPHLLRHTAATRMLANGADVHTVQRILRHSDIRTTLRYLHLVPEQLKEKMRLFSPLGGIDERKRRMVPTRLKRVK
jgi:site-specific recombinase XerD